MDKQAFRATRARQAQENELLREKAKAWRDEETTEQPAYKPVINLRKRNSKPIAEKIEPFWDESGYLIEKKPYRIENEEKINETQKEQKQQPVNKRKQQQSVERLSSYRKNPTIKQSTIDTNSQYNPRSRIISRSQSVTSFRSVHQEDFQDFLKRQAESDRVRKETPQKPKTSRYMSKGSSTIIKQRENKPKEQKAESVAPIPQNSAARPKIVMRLKNQDYQVEKLKKEAKREQLRQEIEAENIIKDCSNHPELLRTNKIPATSRRLHQLSISDERKRIQNKAVEVHPIVEQEEAEYVKPKLGQIPDYVVQIRTALKGSEKPGQKKNRKPSLAEELKAK